MKIGPIDLDLQAFPESKIEDQLRDLLDHVEHRDDRETRRLELKKELNDPYELRKIFSCFANADGGLVVVGIHVQDDNFLTITGLDEQEHPSEQQLRQFLSTKNKIRGFPDYIPRRIDYDGEKLALYQVLRSNTLVEIDYKGAWRVYRREDEGCERLSPLEIYTKTRLAQLLIGDSTTGGCDHGAGVS